MDFHDFQDIVRDTTIYPDPGNNLAYTALGLTGEAGEVADKIKKLIRDHKGVLDEERKTEIIKELGDTLWYLAALANELGITLEEIAGTNARKVKDRKARGVLSGEGDNR